MAGETRDLAALLVEHAAEVERFARRNASPRLLRFESPEDLAQGVIQEALLSANRFEYRSRQEFFAWLWQLARRHFLDRCAYWYAAKRGANRVLRIAQAETGGFETVPGLDPADTGTSPASFAARREVLAHVTRALATLLPRDAEIVRAAAQGATTEDLAEKLGISRTAAERARQRAFERLRKAFELLERRPRSGGA